VWDNLKPAFVVYYGSHLAGLMALYVLWAQGYGWVDAAIGGLAVMCIAGIILAVTALWGIRYPARVEPEPEPIPVPVVVDVPADLLPMPYQDDRQSYEATMQRRKAAPDLALPEPQIARVVMYLLDGAGRASARQLAHICNQTETAKVREWLLRHRWADEHNSTAVLNQAGRAALAELLPHLARE
jgi:hypothetical protein